MKYLIKEILDCEMKIITNIDYMGEHKENAHNLTLEDNVKFVGCTSKPEMSFKKIQVYIFFHLLVNHLAMFYVKQKFMEFQIF